MNKYQRASQIWAVLAFAARSRQSLTYGQLGKLIGVPTAGLGQLLDPIHVYCQQNKLPPLTVIVVQRDSGLPGPGFTGASAIDFAGALASVFSTDWMELGNPQSEAFEAAAKKVSELSVPLTSRGWWIGCLGGGSI